MLHRNFCSSPPLCSRPLSSTNEFGRPGARSLERRPTLTPIQRSSALCGWEVSVSRALNSSTKLITSPSEFLKGAGSHTECPHYECA
ncbi:hypothetical protein AOLI_G00085340 [Acnodon oligacanthus]